MALLMLVMCLVANAQKTITGTVKDTMGEPMIGVSVIVDGTTVGGVTDFNGNFTIQKAPNNAVLKFSYVGYKDKKVSTAGKQSLNVVLEEDAMGLDEVVVVGYGTMSPASSLPTLLRLQLLTPCRLCRPRSPAST